MGATNLGAAKGGDSWTLRIFLNRDARGFVIGGDSCWLSKEQEGGIVEEGTGFCSSCLC